MARTRQRHGMSPSRTALGCHQIVIAAAFVQVGSLCEADVGTAEDQFACANQAVFGGRVFLKYDPREAILSRTVIP